MCIISFSVASGVVFDKTVVWRLQHCRSVYAVWSQCGRGMSVVVARSMIITHDNEREVEIDKYKTDMIMIVKSRVHDSLAACGRQAAVRSCDSVLDVGGNSV